MSYLDSFLFGIFPYIALAVFFAGSLLRFDRDQYTWKSDSSQMLRAGELRWGSNLFHLGILGICFGHLDGGLTPLAVWHALGVTPPAKQMLAMVAGGIAGAVTLVGLILLIYRRLAEPRIRLNSRPMDIAVLLLFLAQLVLGLVSIGASAQHRDGGEMIKLMLWAQHIVTFRGDAAGFVADAALVFKLHLVLGMAIFVIFPFTRLVHVWSGFAAVGYLARAYQVVRSR